MWVSWIIVHQAIRRIKGDIASVLYGIPDAISLDIQVFVIFVNVHKYFNLSIRVQNLCKIF